MDSARFAFKAQVVGPHELQVLGATLLLSACWFVFWRLFLKRPLKLPIVAGGIGALLGIWLFYEDRLVTLLGCPSTRWLLLLPMTLAGLLAAGLSARGDRIRAGIHSAGVWGLALWTGAAILSAFHRSHPL